MRIAHVTHQFFPRYYTGVERLTLNQAAQLRLMGHDTLVIAPALAAADEDYGFDGTRVRVAKHHLVDRMRPWAVPRAAVDELGRLLDEEEVDVVHVAHPMRLPQVFPAAAERGLPVVVHVYDYDYLCFQVVLVRASGEICTSALEGRACISECSVPPAPERIEWGRRVLAGAAAIVAPSRFLADVYAAEGFAGNWLHVPSGVDYSRFGERLPPPGGEGLTLGFIGTLLPHKGPQVVVQALRLLPGRPLRLRLYGESFGKTSFDEELAALIADDDRIELAGVYDHDEFIDVLAPLDAVVLPSTWYENYPNSASSAAAAGVPVIASDLGGLREIVDMYRCGFTFPVGDAEALAELLDRLLDDPELLRGTRRAMGYPFSLEEEAYALEEIFSEATVGAGGVRA
jgi:glycosyltransferase involved in cell wall biosynthesis